MPNQKILLVDDEPTILHSIGYILDKNGFEVSTAGSGEEALAELHTSNYDLLITDLVMEGINGIEVLAEVKKSHLDVCVFILTGYGNTDLAIEAFHAGVDDFILKPCETEELISKIHQFLKKREQRIRRSLLQKTLPVCCFCQKARNDTGIEQPIGTWVPLDGYLQEVLGISVSRGCCPGCYERHDMKFGANKQR